jgi:hypothetical protein
VLRRVRCLPLALLCALPLGLAAAPAAHADAFSDVFKAYKSTGTINPCTFTPAQLAKAKSQIPNDFAQYAPDFKDAIDAAGKARASGACKKTPGKNAGGTSPAGSATPTGTPPAGGAGAPAPGASGTTPAPAPGPTPTPAAAVSTTPQPPPSVVPAPAVSDNAVLAAAGDGQDNGGGLPAPLVGLGVVALLAALAAGLVGLLRWAAVDPLWLQRSRHATAEAGWRTSAAWAEFTDWLRLGR